MKNKEPWEKTLINMSDAILAHPELPVGKAISIEQAKVSFEAGARSRDNEVNLLKSMIVDKGVAINDLKGLLQIAKDALKQARQTE